MPVPPVSQWTFVQWIIAIIVIAACVGIMYVGLGVMGVAIPSWVITIGWICAAAFVGIIAIKFIVSLMGS